jgi:hypothetical protein
MVAPLPRALLGAERPLRAFIGHVEPTFDWTLLNPETQQPLTHMLTTCLSKSLYEPDTPLGHALFELYHEAGTNYAAYWRDREAIDHNIAGKRNWALYHLLVAMDREGVVILGDPTVGLPPLA